MDRLTQEVLTLLHLEIKKNKTILATAEEVAYFGLSPKKEILFSSKAPITLRLESKPLPLETPLDTPQPLPKATAVPIPSKHNPKPSSGMRLAIQKVFPEMALRDAPPPDHLAKKMARLWEETYLSAKVVLISFETTHLEFLTQVTGAVDKLLAPAQLLDGLTFEKEHGWELLLKSPLLQVVICSSWGLWKNSSLAPFYRQNGATQEHFLLKHRLILLEPIARYLKEPELKRKLWKDLNTHLSS